MGCPTLPLQVLCYAAQQCAVDRCIGSRVNQRNFLCNAGFLFKDLLEQLLAVLQGGWSVFMETYTTSMQLAFVGGAQPGAGTTITLEWVDDAFFGFMCESKDVLGSIAGMITSSLGQAISLGRAISDGGFTPGMLVGAGYVDSAVNAMTTQALHGTAEFLYQLFLAPLYVFIAMQKSVVCIGNSMASITSESGFSVVLGRQDLQAASDAASGVCVYALLESQADDPASARSSGGMGRSIQGVVQAAERSTVSFVFDLVVHAIDAIFCYAIGVAKGLQSMAIDTPNCNLPDYYSYRLLTCACGDSPAFIPAERQNQTYREYAHWCSGTLLLTDGFGVPRYVFNPFSYAALRQKVGDADRYLRCLSRPDDGSFAGISCHDLAPRVEEIDSQGVTAMSVLQRCKANYQQKAWDTGAFVLYDEEAFNLHVGASRPGDLAPSNVSTCLLQAEADGASNVGCVQAHTRSEGAVYWRYDMDGGQQGAPATTTTPPDACLVFSGPSSNPSLLNRTREAFENCTNHRADHACDIAPIIWSAGSRNRVPVATEHSMGVMRAEDREAMATAMFQRIRDDVVPVLEGLLDFEEEALDVVLFSAEGDSLHQIFDCIAMGPYSRVDFWTSGSDGSLPVPFWSRDSTGVATSRDLELPCDIDRLHGDTIPPFTCGSEARRSIIKYFVRDEINANEQGNTVTESLVRRQVERLLEAWRDPARYACSCPGGGNAFSCCVPGAGNSLYPQNIDVEYDQIPSEDILEHIVGLIPAYWEKVFTRGGPTGPILKYMPEEESSSYRWENSPSRTAASVEA